MAGFEEFLTVIKEASNNKSRSYRVNGLDGILARINETVKMQNEGKDREEQSMDSKASESESTNDKKVQDNRLQMVKPNTEADNKCSVIKSNDIFDFEHISENIVQGIIFSEILGRPKSRRRRAR